MRHIAILTSEQKHFFMARISHTQDKRISRCDSEKTVVLVNRSTDVPSETMF